MLLFDEVMVCDSALVILVKLDGQIKPIQCWCSRAIFSVGLEQAGAEPSSSM